MWYFHPILNTEKISQQWSGGRKYQDNVRLTDKWTAVLLSRFVKHQGDVKQARDNKKRRKK